MTDTGEIMNSQPTSHGAPVRSTLSYMDKKCRIISGFDFMHGTRLLYVLMLYI